MGVLIYQNIRAKIFLLAAFVAILALSSASFFSRQLAGLMGSQAHSSVNNVSSLIPNLCADAQKDASNPRPALFIGCGIFE